MPVVLIAVGLAVLGTNGANELRSGPPELSHWSVLTPRHAVIERSSIHGATLYFRLAEKPWVISTLGCCGTPTSATVCRPGCTPTSGPLGATQIWRPAAACTGVMVPPQAAPLSVRAPAAL
ncbi:hypothetical protein D9M73_145590 [compost metagenome]